MNVWSLLKGHNAWNTQPYTSKPAGGAPEENQAKSVVLDMTAGFQRHITTCDNFFTSFALGQELLRKNWPRQYFTRRNASHYYVRHEISLACSQYFIDWLLQVTGWHTFTSKNDRTMFVIILFVSSRQWFCSVVWWKWIKAGIRRGHTRGGFSWRGSGKP